jgi:hypothetical protein
VLESDLSEAWALLEIACRRVEGPRESYLEARGRLVEITERRRSGECFSFDVLLGFYERWRITSHRLYPLAKAETELRGWHNGILNELKLVNHALDYRMRRMRGRA